MRRIGRAILALLATGFACVAYLYLTLPDVRGLRTANPRPPRSWSSGRARRATRGEQPRRVQKWVSYPRISQQPHARRARRRRQRVLAHEGVDYEQLKESIEANLERMEFARGGSTITQQLAKNLYLSPSKNPIRKLRELLIARRLETELTEAAHPRAVSERDRVGGRHLRRRSGGADVLSEVRRGSRPAGIRAARRRDHQPARCSIPGIRPRACAGASRWSCGGWGP